MRQSMTGFASREGRAEGRAWSWELRGVNARGLDLRLRLPDGIPGLETALRARLAERLARGSVQASLRLAAEGGDTAPRIDRDALVAALDALREATRAAEAAGVALAPSRAADLLAVRGVMTTEAPAPDPEGLRAALLADFDAVLDAFVAMRGQEGARLGALATGHLDEIARLIAEAEAAVAARDAARPGRLRAQIARVIEAADGVDADRLAQELAILAAKGDVTEEIDRLRAHLEAARALLADPAPAGRKLDFLCQELMREANTLCAKSGEAALTGAGLALKTVIEQLREQIQNLE